MRRYIIFMCTCVWYVCLHIVMYLWKHVYVYKCLCTYQCRGSVSLLRVLYLLGLSLWLKVEFINSSESNLLVSLHKNFPLSLSLELQDSRKWSFLVSFAYILGTWTSMVILESGSILATEQYHYHLYSF